MGALTIALTGGTGFVGRNLITTLVNAGHTVVALHRREELVSLPHHVRLIWASLEAMENYLFTRRFDALIHLATAYGPGLTFAEMVAVNVELPLRLLERGVLGGCSLFVNTDTYFSKPIFDYPHMRPYIQSKLDLLNWLQLYTNSKFGIKVINARLEHVYGPGDGGHKFVPFVLSKLLVHEPIDLTPGEQMRDFIYIQDVVSGYLTLINSASCLPTGVTEIQVGTGTAISVKTFVETAKELSGSRSELKFGALSYRDREIMNSFADTRVLNAIGWLPRFTLLEGIKLTLKAIINQR